MKSNLLKIVAGMLLFATSLNAQIPVLNVNGKKSNAEVYLQSLDIQVEVIGNIASTKYVMVFKNRTSKILEGELIFPLPDGVTISHYALDINGKMREAVPVEKAKATQIFEEIEQRRIDPGLIEKIEGNNFRTRIYPVPANGTRTISIGYEEELKTENGMFRYRLPMDYKDAIENFAVKATVWQTSVKPQLTEKFDSEITFDKQGNNFVATFSRKNYMPSRTLAFSLPAPQNIPQVLMQSASGSYYFVASCLPKKELRNKQWSNNIGIIWDASLSGLSRDVKKETDLLDIIMQNKKNLTVSLYILNNNFAKIKTFNIKNGDWTDLRKALESVIYDGGTNYSTINLQNTSEKEFLFFSDGLSTLSDAVTVSKFPILQNVMQTLEVQKQFANKQVHCIVSSAKADYGSLKLIAAQTKGKFINLNILSGEKIKNELLHENLNFLGVENIKNVREIYPSVSTPVSDNFSVAGIADAQQASVTLLFGYGNTPEQKITVNLDAKNAVQQGNVHRIWAQKKINELDMCYEKNKDELTELGQQFGIVTRNTSLIVLETLQDYITYNIIPPQELQEEFYRWRKNREDEKLRTEQNILAQAISAAKTLKTWWDTDFAPKKPKYPKPDDKNISENTRNIESEDNKSDDVLREDESNIAYSITSVEEEMPAVVDEKLNIAENEISANESAKNVSNLGYFRLQQVDYRSKQSYIKEEVEATPQSQPKIKIMPLKQDSEYMKSLTGKSEDDYKTYLKLRNDYINTPNFYFDMADWFYKLNDKEKALKILTSIAEIDIENASLFRLLGYRLKEYKAYELEIYICKKVIQWRPMETQSYRDYALALADNGKNQDALNALYSAITQSYSQNINNRSIGIEEVIVTEINQLISKTDKLNTNAIDKNLIKPMPVDIRVVINWNMNNTDIDLHVKDPNNETCSYSHKSTEIGGRISADITQGYGPEQFMLKKAIKGKYEVFVNYFGDSQVKAEGPSTIMVEIYTKYSNADEQRQIVCVQMSKNNANIKNGLLKLAEFEF
ncbi:MAG: DUF2135 domain-containing protein [Prevotellaceae bacterium]|jgi:hypothetical protein|nr:DUF2135 domain-containing protein [Prevotellaceae bacterium]